MGGNMKVHQYEFPRGMLISSWDQQSQLSETSAPASLSSFCQRFRPLLPSSHTTATSSNSSTAFRFDLKSFIKPHHCGSSNEINVSSSDDKVRDHQLTQVQVETLTHPGGTRWNPTQEQIGILERLYKEGVRTPNSQQIEQITSQLAKYGKIEGKNVFYWFQNHKARQRQKLKRRSLGLAHSPRASMATISSTTSSMEDREFEDSPLKRKRNARSFLERSECDKMSTREDRGRAVSTFEPLSERLFGLATKPTLDGGDETLELFPLHPEGRS